MATKKRFPDWKPEVGERALVPGGPGCAHYVDVLNIDDVRAIENGHRGYTPLRVKIVDVSLIGTRYELQATIMVLNWNERRHQWEGPGVWKTLSAALRAARYHNDDGDVRYVIDNDANRYFNNQSARTANNKIVAELES